MTKRGVERKGSIRLDPDDYPRLSRNEFEKVRDLFRRYDTHNSGSIKKNDLFDLFKGNNPL